MNQQYPHDPNQPVAPAPAPKTTRKVRTVAIVVGAVLAVFPVVGIALGVGGNQPNSAETPTAFKVTGTVTVEAGDGSDPNMGKSCITDGGYSDISTGAQVTVKNGTGKVIAPDSLGPGFTSDWLTLPTFDPETGTIESRPQATKCRFASPCRTFRRARTSTPSRSRTEAKCATTAQILATSLALKLG